jgi:multicomponent K+:H+ antiporter subunit E
VKRPPILLIVMLTCMWLLLNNTLSPGHIVLGLVVSTVMTLGFRAVRPLQPRVKRPQAVIRLLGRVLVDVVRSNIAVARIVLGLVGGRQIKSGFLQIPMDMRDPHGLAVLATIITSTPGTVWVDLTLDGSTLTLHVLDLRDEAGWIRTIKNRYEQPLMEIFE